MYEYRMNFIFRVAFIFISIFSVRALLKLLFF